MLLQGPAQPAAQQLLAQQAGLARARPSRRKRARGPSADAALPVLGPQPGPGSGICFPSWAVSGPAVEHRPIEIDGRPSISAEQKPCAGHSPNPNPFSSLSLSCLQPTAAECGQGELAVAGDGAVPSDRVQLAPRRQLFLFPFSLLLTPRRRQRRRPPWPSASVMGGGAGPDPTGPHLLFHFLFFLFQLLHHTAPEKCDWRFLRRSGPPRRRARSLEGERATVEWALWWCAVPSPSGDFRNWMGLRVGLSLLGLGLLLYPIRNRINSFTFFPARDLIDPHRI